MIPGSPKRLWRKGGSKRAIGPDVSPKIGRLWRRKTPESPKSTAKKPPGICFLTSLPHEVLLDILTFLSVLEVDGNLKLVCKSLSRECESRALWQFFCNKTGKLNVPVSDSVECTKDSQVETHPLREHYYKIPCVPTDFASITAALIQCPSGGTITLLPGVYEERITIRKSVHIRAASPERGAAIVWYKGLNHPCVAVGDVVREDSVVAKISNVQLLHSTMGSDIWGGNCAVLVEGRKNRLSLASCCIQSESGRGVVATNGSYLEMKESVIHDCAATGLYLGDNDSIANISGCNLIRNGGGSRRPLETDSDGNEEDDTDRVPSGHSGMYVEAGRAFVENSLVAANSLTGVSIVRGGGVIISGCDVAENGSEPILVEDSFEVDTPGRRNRRPVGVEEGPVRNNYGSRSNDAPPLQDIIHSVTDFGGPVRETQFKHVMTSKLMSTEAHESRYR